MTTATGDDDNNVNGDGAMGSEVDDDGDGVTGDHNDDDDDGNGDGATGSGAMGYDDDDSLTARGADQTMTMLKGGRARE